MQRVLSFQLARGFGESSEFVTKRMCFSFLFSVAFLSVLCGFLLGRFATERTIAFRAEKKQLELAGNGLESTEYIRHLLLRDLDGVFLNSDDFTTKDDIGSWEADRQQIKEVMSNLSLVPRLVEYEFAITLMITGDREPDRYVVVSASRKEIAVALEILKALGKIHRDYDWKPRRTMAFCLFSSIEDACMSLIPHATRRKIVGYIALHPHTLPGPGDINIAATEVPLSIVSKIIMSMSRTFTDPIDISLSRSSDTAMDAPHVTFSHAGGNQTTDAPVGATITILAQIVSETIWRFSESLFVKWDPNEFKETGLKVLGSFNDTELRDVRDKLLDTMQRLVFGAEVLNKRIDTIDPTTTMDLRVFNDICMDLGRALMCPDRTLKESLHWENLQNLHNESTTKISLYINEMITCYDSTIHILYDW